MHPVRRQRLLLVAGAIVLLGMAVALTAWALRENLKRRKSQSRGRADQAAAAERPDSECQDESR